MSMYNSSTIGNNGKAAKQLTINTPQQNLGTYKPFHHASYRKDGREYYYYNICMMSDFEDRFPFLIRLEDYRAGKTMANYNSSKNGYGQNTNTGFGSNNNTGFGQNNNSGFGQNNNTGFGNNNTSGFGNSSTGFGGNNTTGFGNNNNTGFGNNNNTGFGNNNTGFGQNKLNTGFGSNNNTGFGSNNNTGFGSNNNTGFGSNNNTSGFGQNKTNTGFGNNNTGFGNNNTGFGQNNNTGFGNNNTGFGNNNTGFGQNKSNTGFGSNNNTGFGSNNNTGFGQNKTNTGFGNNNTGFGSNNNTSGFGQNKTNTGFGGFGQNNNTGFGNNNTGFGQNNNTGFGSNNNTSGFGNNNTGFGQNNTGFGQNKSNTSSFGGFGNNNTNTGFGNNNNTSGFGGFGQNKTNTSGFGNNNNNSGFGGFGNNNSSGFGQNNNNSGFGGFGQNNNNSGFGGFGQNNNNSGFGGFGQNSNTGFGQNNAFNQTTLTSSNGLLAGGFNAITEKVKETPYKHLQDLTQSIENNQNRMMHQSNFFSSSSSIPFNSSINSNHFEARSLVVSPTPTPAQPTSSTTQSNQSTTQSIPSQYQLGVSYNNEIQTLSVSSSILIRDLCPQIQSLFSISQKICLVYNHHLLLPGSSLSSCLPNGAVITVFTDNQSISSSTPTPSTLSSYSNHAPKLTKKDYSITPSIDTLKSMMAFELTTVAHVAVEHKGIGKIEWEEPVDLRDIDLDEVIEIEKTKEGSSYISVYENLSGSSQYPAVGVGLNHPAILTLYGVFPKSGSTIPEDFLKEKTKEIGGEFISYDNKTGTWSFRVPHFTRYGFDVDDEEDEEIIEEEQTNKRIMFHSISDLFYISKQPRLSCQPCQPIHTTPSISYQPIQTQPLICPSSRKQTISHIQTVPIQTHSHLKTSSPSYSFPVLIKDNQLLSIHSYSTISSSPIFTDSSKTDIDNCMEILRSFTVYPNQQLDLIPQVELPCNDSLISFTNALIASFPMDSPSHIMSNLFFQLLQILFLHSTNQQDCYSWSPNTPFDISQLSSKQQQSLFLKRRQFSRWLEQAVQSSLWKEDLSFPSSDSPFTPCLAFLYHHDIENTCKYLQEQKYERLAIQVSQINCSSDFRWIMNEQVQRWSNEGVLTSIDPSQKQLLLFLAGDISILQSVQSWLYQLALYVWYIASPTDPLEAIFYQFFSTYMTGQEVVVPWYEEKQQDTEEDCFFLFMEYFVHISTGVEYDETVLFHPLNYTDDIHDMFLPTLSCLLLSTQLQSQVLSSYFLQISYSFIEQLNSLQLWHWSVFLTLFHPYQPFREQLVKSIITSHIGECVKKDDLEGDLNTAQLILQSIKENYYINIIENDLGISPIIVYEALSYYAHYEKMVLLEVTCQLSSNDYNGAFLNLIREILPIAICKNDVGLIQMSLRLFADHEEEVSLWREIGDVLEEYVNYLACVPQSEEDFVEGEDLLKAVENWSCFEEILKKENVEKMITEMAWRIIAQLVEYLKKQDSINWEYVQFVLTQMQQLHFPFDIKKILYDSLQEIIPM